MPKKGFVNLTIKESVAKKLVDLAKRLGKSPPETVGIVVDAYVKRDTNEVSNRPNA